MKFKNLIIRVSLIIAVLLSLVFSYYIWTSDQRYSVNLASKQSLKIQKKEAEPITNLILPAEIILNDAKHQSYQLHDNKQNLPLDFTADVKKARAKSLKKLASNSENYQKMLVSASYYQLVYPDKITLNTFLKINNIKLETKLDATQFNRIFVPAAKNNVLYLGDDQHDQLVKITFSRLNLEKLQQSIKDTTNCFAITQQKFDQQYLPLYLTDNQVNIYSYLIATQSESTYVTKLLGGNDVESKKTATGVTYSTGLYKKLIYNNETGIYSFTDYQQDTIPKKLSVRLQNSYDYLTDSGINLTDTRYFEANNSKISYRYFVEGFPVFDENNTAPAIQAEFSTTGFKLNFKNRQLQIPIPSDGRKVTVPKTTTVLEQLKQKGYLDNEIEKIVLSFKLVHDAENDKLIDLVPTYYVKINGEWQDYTTWLGDDNYLTGEE